MLIIPFLSEWSLGTIDLHNAALWRTPSPVFFLLMLPLRDFHQAAELSDGI